MTSSVYEPLYRFCVLIFHFHFVYIGNIIYSGCNMTCLHEYHAQCVPLLSTLVLENLCGNRELYRTREKRRNKSTQKRNCGKKKEKERRRRKNNVFIETCIEHTDTSALNREYDRYTITV